MNLFAVNHTMNGGVNPCVCEKQARSSNFVALNQINLDNLTAVEWQDDMWVVYFGDNYYRVHDEDKMLALEKALEGHIRTRPKRNAS